MTEEDNDNIVGLDNIAEAVIRSQAEKSKYLKLTDEAVSVEASELSAVLRTAGMPENATLSRGKIPDIVAIEEKLKQKNNKIVFVNNSVGKKDLAAGILIHSPSSWPTLALDNLKNIAHRDLEVYCNLTPGHPSQTHIMELAGSLFHADSEAKKHTVNEEAFDREWDQFIAIARGEEVEITPTIASASASEPAPAVDPLAEAKQKFADAMDRAHLHENQIAFAKERFNEKLDKLSAHRFGGALGVGNNKKLTINLSDEAIQKIAEAVEENARFKEHPLKTYRIVCTLDELLLTQASIEPKEQQEILLKKSRQWMRYYLSGETPGFFYEKLKDSVPNPAYLTPKGKIDESKFADLLVAIQAGDFRNLPKQETPVPDPAPIIDPLAEVKQKFANRFLFTHLPDDELSFAKENFNKKLDELAAHTYGFWKNKRLKVSLSDEAIKKIATAVEKNGTFSEHPLGEYSIACALDEMLLTQATIEPVAQKDVLLQKSREWIKDLLRGRIKDEPANPAYLTKGKIDESKFADLLVAIQAGDFRNLPKQETPAPKEPSVKPNVPPPTNFDEGVEPAKEGEEKTAIKDAKTSVGAVGTWKKGAGLAAAGAAAYLLGKSAEPSPEEKKKESNSFIPDALKLAGIAALLGGAFWVTKVLLSRGKGGEGKGV